MVRTDQSSYPSSSYSSSSSSSILHLLRSRQDGRFSANSSSNNQFSGIVCRDRVAAGGRRLLRAPRIVNPGTPASAATRPPLRPGRVPVASSLDLSAGGGRFLLAGRRDGSVLLYDLSVPWGRTTTTAPQTTTMTTNNHRDQQRPSSFVHSPVAQASAAAAASSGGGGGTVVQSARWYPSDSGAFLTATSSGKLTVWDAHRMEPVVSYAPFVVVVGGAGPTTADTDTDPTGATSPISSMDVSHLNCNTVAVSSLHESVVRLVDVRSGAASHSLIGHGGHGGGGGGGAGVLSVRWSPASEYALASGGADCCVRLWDVRKSGGRACLAVLGGNADDDAGDEGYYDPCVSRPYRPHYAHLREKLSCQRQQKKKRKLQQQHPQQRRRSAPNDYRRAEAASSTSTSMDEPVREVAFDRSGHYLVSCGTKLCLWDLRFPAGGYRVPRRFTTSGGSAAIVRPDSSNNKLSQPVPLTITDDGGDPTVWVSSGSGNGQQQPCLAGYSLHGRDSQPIQELKGHMKGIVALAATNSASSSNRDDGAMMLFTSGQDSLILSWGPPECSGKTKKNAGQSRVTTSRKRDQRTTGADAEDRDNW